MFYLTYRPKTVTELDNSQVKEKLQHLLSGKSLPHALLLIGPKGMGKTSTARIFAKALNCKKNKYSGVGQSFEPCNKCDNCQSIDSDSMPDVLEQDAASNRGIEEVRKLIRESAYAPMQGRYRVYIIDEAHMITSDAFNALLKTLEEPPANVIFILATTNDEKIPKTILSRCFIISFGRAKSEDIAHMLTRISVAEGVKLSETVKNLIITHSDYSFRDATKLLEDLILQNKLELESAQKYLGVYSRKALLALLKTSSMKEALSWVNNYTENGGDIKRAIEDLLQTLQVQLLLKSGVVDDGDDLGFDIEEITLIMKLLHEAYKNMKHTPIPSLPLEIAIVEFYNLKTRV